ncbi:DUF1127 domain-containing protein [Marivita sp. S0852]|uniref:DUF1127 domain-containing protein n=1 Tax=Marivita sp. S0852 TaxID=3373893 RepID=UPI0039822D07
MTHATQSAHLAYLGDQTSLTPAATVAVRVAVVLTQWTERRRTRRHLGQLDDHLLRDVGLDRLAAQREADRKFWQV